MAPALGGQASGLSVACTLTSTDLAPQLKIKDYADAQWHWGAARTVAVSAKRTGAAPGTPSGAVIVTCATNNTTASVACAGSTAAAGAAAGNLAIGAADVNHSIEYPTSATNLTGIFIAPGTFIKSVSTNQVTLSKPVLTAGPWPACAGSYVSGCSSLPVKVLVSNDTGRQVTDGVTTSGSACISSVSANFKAADVGMQITGGDIPDGATISAFPGTGCGTATTSVNITCVGCAPTVPLSSASSQVLSLSPAKPPTTSRYVTDGAGSGTRILSSATAVFAPSDVGLPITFVPPIATLAGARVGTIGTNGANTTIAGAGAATIPSGPKKFVIGNATKTAPATGDSGGTLAIVLTVNPLVSPTSPPCAAGKVSGFHIPTSWRNPQGTTALTTNVLPASGYNTFVGTGGTQVSGTTPASTSIAQLDFRTASTSFSGYVEQKYTYTTAGNVMSASTYQVEYTFLPIGVGVCPGQDLAAQWTFFGLSKKIVENPSFTGGGGGGERGLKPEKQGTSTNYTGATGAQFTAGANPIPTTNACQIDSPPTVKPGC